ncbi:DUF1304 domain-containing protein [Leucothrix sargassi]|nr:DUF1304 domain-containing protein [Leucothrix sargassi]
MDIIAKGLVLLVALEHIYILVLEMFLWTTPKAMKIFGTTPDQAESTKVFAANQGVYNGFLAAGLLWSLFHADSLFSFQLQVFFLACVLVAAVYGCMSFKRSIIVTQGLPAFLAMVFVLLAGA